jgi:urease accessory protein
METDRSLAASRLAPVRANAGIDARFVAENGHTRLAALSESDGYHLRLPNTRGGAAEGVIINSGGGLVGGDRVAFRFAVGEGASVRIATVAAERVYRSLGPASEVDIQLCAAAGARLDWLPQETILFSGARVRRRLDADLAGDAALLLADCTVFGRLASGERMASGLLRDVRCIRRDGRLVLADSALLDGDIGSLLARSAVTAGARATALVLYVAPDAEARLASVRAVLGEALSEVGASAWDGMLVVRLLAPAAQDLRADLTRVVEHLAAHPIPRVWEG